MRAGIVFFAVWFSAAAGLLRADTLYLKNGRSIRGVVTKEGGRYTVDMGYGKAVFTEAEVDRVEKEDKAEYYKKNAYELLSRREFSPALDQAELWKKSGGDLEELAGFQRKYFLAAGKFLIERGVLDKAEKVLNELDTCPEREELERIISEFRRKNDALLQNAESYYAKGKYSAALNSYRDLYFHCPDVLDRIRRKFSDACIKAGEELFRRGEFERADALYSSGFSIDPELFELLKDKWAAAKIEGFRNDPKSSSPKMIRALADLVPENLTVLHLAGIASLENGDLKSAYSYFSEITGDQPLSLAEEADAERVAELRKKAEAVLGKRHEPEPVDVQKDENSGYFISAENTFVISAGDAETVRRARIVLNHFIRKIQEQFTDNAVIGRLKNMAAAVIIFPDRELFQKVSGSDAEQGNTKLVIKDGKLESITVFSHRDADGLFLSVLAHELGHAVLSFLTLDNGSIPLGIQEGFAVFCEPHFKRKYYADLLNSYLGERRMPGLEVILNSESYPSNQSLFYALSFSVTDALIAEMGLDRFIDFAADLKKMDFSRAVRKHTQWKSISTFEKHWRLFVKNGFITRNT